MSQSSESKWKEHALVLGLVGDRATLTPKIIDEAFRDKKILWHPDKYPNEKDRSFAHDQYIRAQEARDYLQGEHDLSASGASTGNVSNCKPDRFKRRSSLDEPATPPSVVRNISRTEILKLFQ